MEKKNYLTPELEITELSDADIITTSTDSEDGEYSGTYPP